MDQPERATDPESEDGPIDKIAPAVSWIGAIFFFLAALGTVTESGGGMPGRLLAGTAVYVLLGAFATPPGRRYLDDEYDVSFGRVAVVVILFLGIIVNEGFVAPPAS